MQIFDGHNDVLGRLWSHEQDAIAGFAAEAGHVNRDACAAGGFAGGFFAVYSPGRRAPFDFALIGAAPAPQPLPEPLEPGWALQSAMAQVGMARQLHAAGHIDIVTAPARLERSFAADPVTCILHLEGADCIDPELAVLEALFAAGLRSLGPVWSRPTIFGHGVPFVHHSDGDTGPGLTEAGHRLVQRCGELGILLDVSHITVKGFWDIAEQGRPIMATHSNAWARCASSRNLTDAQLDAIAQSDGIAGLNFEPSFVADHGWETGRVALEDCLRQLDYMIEKLGEGRVALGSDFDGARLPDGMSSAADLPRLVAAMEAAGYGVDLIARLCHRNWLDFLKRNLSPAART